MSRVGQLEKKTQQRVVKLFHDQLGYDCLGDWTDREGNRNIEDVILNGKAVAARIASRMAFCSVLILKAIKAVFSCM